MVKDVEKDLSVNFKSLPGGDCTGWVSSPCSSVGRGDRGRHGRAHAPCLRGEGLGKLISPPLLPLLALSLSPSSSPLSLCDFCSGRNPSSGDLSPPTNHRLPASAVTPVGCASTSSLRACKESGGEPRNRARRAISLPRLRRLLRRNSATALHPRFRRRHARIEGNGPNLLDVSVRSLAS